jgi:hypothetical protein
LKGIYSILREKFEEDENPSGCEYGNEDGDHVRNYK